MTAVRNINITKIPNNKPKALPPAVPKGSPVPPNGLKMNGIGLGDGDHEVDTKEDDSSIKEIVSKESHLFSVHIMTVIKCIESVWERLGPAHRESAYQKAFMVRFVNFWIHSLLII